MPKQLGRTRESFIHEMKVNESRLVPYDEFTEAEASEKLWPARSRRPHVASKTFEIAAGSTNPTEAIP
jgi:hypothetical protein